MNSACRSEDEHAAPPRGLRRAFLAWLVDVRPRLAVGLHNDQSTPDSIEFSLAVANPVLHGFLADQGNIVVSVDWVGENWDFLLDLDVRPRATADGFVCSICNSEGKHRIFPSLEALWRDHLFDPFEEWINTKLAGAHAIALYRTVGGGGTWARLVPKGEYATSPFLIAL